MLYHVEGLVVRAMDYKESDKIVTVFSREHGKLRFVANGVRKVKSRYGSACQQFTHGHFSFYLNKQLGTLRHAEVIHSFYDVRANLDRAAFAAYVAELLDVMTHDAEPNQRLFESFHAGLSAIAGDREPRVIVLLFELALLTAQGYAPQWRTCVQCGIQKSSFKVSAATGGVLCASCAPIDPQARPISLNVRRLLYAMQQMEVTQLGDVELSEQTLLELERVTRGFMDYHIDYPWKSRAFLDQWRTLP